MCVPAHLGMSLLLVLWASMCLADQRQGCAFFVSCRKTRNIKQDRETIFPHATCKIKRKVYINGDRRSGEKDLCKKRLFQYGSTETWKLLHKSLYRSKACQCAYLHATHLGMSLLLWLFGLPSASLNRRQDMPFFFLFCP